MAERPPLLIRWRVQFQSHLATSVYPFTCQSAKISKPLALQVESGCLGPSAPCLCAGASSMERLCKRVSLNRLRLRADELVFAVAHIHNSLLSQRSRVRESSPSPYDAATIDSKLLISRRLLSGDFPPNLTMEKLRGVAHAISGPLEGHEAIELQRILDGAAKIGTLEIGLSHSLFFELFISKVSEFSDTKTQAPPARRRPR